MYNLKIKLELDDNISYVQHLIPYGHNEISILHDTLYSANNSITDFFNDIFNTISTDKKECMPIVNCIKDSENLIINNILPKYESYSIVYELGDSKFEMELLKSNKNKTSTGNIHKYLEPNLIIRFPINHMAYILKDELN